MSSEQEEQQYFTSGLKVIDFGSYGIGPSPLLEIEGWTPTEILSTFFSQNGVSLREEYTNSLDQIEVEMTALMLINMLKQNNTN